MMEVVLSSKKDLRVADVPDLLSWVIHPDVVQCVSDIFCSKNGLPLVSDPPYMMRYWAKKRITRMILDGFESGDLRLIDQITRGYVEPSMIPVTNALDCYMRYRDFVNFAGQFEVKVTLTFFLLRWLKR